MNITDKVKDFVDDIASAITSSSNNIENVLDGMESLLKVETEISEDTKEVITALNTFAENEDKSENEILTSLRDLFEGLNDERIKRIEQMNFKFTVPLEQLLISHENLQLQLKEAEKYKKKFEKAKKKYEKEKSRPEDKIRFEKLKEKELTLEDAKRKHDAEDSEADLAIKMFEEEKSKTLREIFNAVVDIETNFHESMLENAGKLKAKRFLTQNEQPEIAQESIES